MEFLEHFIEGIANKMGCGIINDHSMMQKARLLYFVERLCTLFAGNIALEVQLMQHLLYPTECSLWMQERIASNRRTRDTCKHSGLGYVKLLCRRRVGRIFQIEVSKRGCIGSIGLFPIIDGVQIHSEYLVFAVVPRHFWRQNNLLQFTVHLNLVSYIRVLNQF